MAVNANSFWEVIILRLQRIIITFKTTMFSKTLVFNNVTRHDVGILFILRVLLG